MVRRAVLLGAGHAHLFTLKRTAAFVRRASRLVLVAPEILLVLGLATGVLAGITPRHSTRSTWGALVSRGGRFIRARATPSTCCPDRFPGHRSSLSMTCSPAISAASAPRRHPGAATHGYACQAGPQPLGTAAALEVRMGPAAPRQTLRS